VKWNGGELPRGMERGNLNHRGRRKRIFDPFKVSLLLRGGNKGKRKETRGVKRGGGEGGARKTRCNERGIREPAGESNRRKKRAAGVSSSKHNLGKGSAEGKHF